MLYVMDQVKMTVRMEPELLRRLRLVAVREDKTVSEIIRGFVLAYVEAREGS